MKLHRLFLLLAFASLIFTPVHAQGAEPPIPTAPVDGKYVVDELDWLTGKDEARINAIVSGLDNDGVAEIAVVTLNDCGADKEAFRKELFDTWGIGHADDDDGLLILVCWYGGDESRRSVEQLYGPGLSRALSSSKTDQIAQENLVSAFRLNRPGDGLVEMVKAYDALLRNPMASNDFFTSAITYWKSMDGGSQVLLGMIVVVLIISIKERFFSSSRGGNSNGERYPYDRESGGSVGDSGGGSDGGDGSSTRF